MSQQLDRARGSMAGLAIGDALGRPVEGMSYQAIRENTVRLMTLLISNQQVVMTLNMRC